MSDVNAGERLSVFKWDGLNWQIVGLPGFSFDILQYHINLLFDINNTPYVATFESIGLITVYQYKFGAWNYLGPTIDAPTNAGVFGFGIDNYGIPYLVNQDSWLQRYNGSAWEFLDSIPGQLFYPDIAFDQQNNIYISCNRIPGGLNVYKYNGCNSDSLDISSIVTEETAGYDGAIDLSCSGGTSPYSFLWNNGATTEDIFSLDGGIYYVTITDDNGNCRTEGITLNSTVPIGLLTGHVILDIDSNCVFDGIDNGVSHQWVVATNGIDTFSAYTNTDGEYSFQLPQGNYFVTPQNYYYVHSSCDDTIAVTLIGADTVNVDFSFDINSIIDVGVSVSCSGIAPGFPGYFVISIHNNDPLISNLVDGSLCFVLPDTLIFTSATPTPTSISGDTICWNYFNLGSSQNFNVHFTCPANPALIGTTIQAACADVTVSTGVDLNPGNNEFCFDQIITGSYDPNDKSVSPVGFGIDGEIPVEQEELTYLIRFQNTGNDTAINIFITDTLSVLLDPASVQMLSSSHDYVLNIINGNVLRWRFDDIYLPDSNVNEPASHGYVHFKIKTLNTPVIGQVVNNAANIYFDFNPPIITNTTVNTYALVSGTEEFVMQSSILAFPNPFNDYLTVLNNDSDVEMNITDTFGKDLKRIRLSTGYNTIDLKWLSKGIYIVRAGNYTTKIVKE